MARAKKGEGIEDDPCITSPEARYRGAENQLYRVEVHRGGQADDATFKWSRDNGSIVFPILWLKDNEAGLAHLGRDSSSSLQVGDWVEIVDDDYVLRGNRWQIDYQDVPLVKVVGIDAVEMKVTLQAPGEVDLPTYPYPEEDKHQHPLLRRWDHKAGDPDEDTPELADDGALLIQEGIWFTLEDGVQIWFDKLDAGNAYHEYRTGDYWLIPARTETGDVEWPGPEDNPEALPPHGVTHYYAPLALMASDGTRTPCRNEIKIQNLVDPAT